MNRKDYVTFHTAKLLRAAGYPQELNADTKVYVLTRCGEYTIVSNADLTSPNPQRVVAPHLWDAMKWLRERHGIHIEGEPYFIDKYGNKTTVWRTVTAILPEQMEGIGEDRYTTYEQACDAGVAAACEWLAKNN